MHVYWLQTQEPTDTAPAETSDSSSDCDTSASEYSSHSFDAMFGEWLDDQMERLYVTNSDDSDDESDNSDASVASAEYSDQSHFSTDNEDMYDHYRDADDDVSIDLSVE